MLIKCVSKSKADEMGDADRDGAAVAEQSKDGINAQFRFDEDIPSIPSVPTYCYIGLSLSLIHI